MKNLFSFTSVRFDAYAEMSFKDCILKERIFDPAVGDFPVGTTITYIVVSFVSNTMSFYDEMANFLGVFKIKVVLDAN